MKSTITGLLLFFCSCALFSQSDYHESQLLVYFTKPFTYAQQLQIAASHDMEIIWVSPLSNTHLWRMIGNDAGGLNGDINEKVGQVDDPDSGVNGFLDYETWVPNGDNGPDWVNGDPSRPCNGSISTVLPSTFLEAGLRIAILDTGIGGMLDADGDFYFMHPNLFDHRDNFGLGWNMVEDSAFPLDDHGHGTHISGIIAQVLNAANVETDLLHYKTHDSSGKGYVSNLIYAIDRAAIASAQIINMSCSYQSQPTPTTAPLQRAIEIAGLHNGVLVVTSAGNDGQDIDHSPYPNYPAAFASENILTVGSIDCENNLSGFSNFGGGSVDIACPGENIVGPSFAQTGGYLSKSGTSQSTAIVTGVAAQMALRQDVVHYEGIICAILDGSEDIGLPNEFASGAVIDATGASSIGMQACGYFLQSIPSLIVPDAESQSPDQHPREEFSTQVDANNPHLRLSPNPASHQFVVDLPHDLVGEKEVQIRLVGVDGRSYHINALALGEQKIRIQPDANMPSGVYFVYLTQAKNNYATRLIWQGQ